MGKLSENLTDKNVLLTAKIAFFIYIVLSPFINYKYLAFMNQIGWKVLLLVIIVAATFVDLQLSIIMTLAFLILMIHLNKDVIFGGALGGMRENFSIGLPVAELQRIKDVPGGTISDFPDKCGVEFEQSNSGSGSENTIERANINLYDLYIDPKIKPYEAYIRQLSNPLDIENAANAMI